MRKGFIICVDDQPEIVGSLLAQLEHAVGDACEIEVAESAEEALTVLNELEEQGEQVDIVITDEIMPGMQGSHFLEIVHKKNPNIMTVILTGHATMTVNTAARGRQLLLRLLAGFPAYINLHGGKIRPLKGDRIAAASGADVRTVCFCHPEGSVLTGIRPC